MKGNIFSRNGLVEPGDLVFDIGCKVGKITDLFLAVGAKVICIEPFPVHVKTMREKYRGKVEVIQAAVSYKPGKDHLYYNSRGKMNPTMTPKVYSQQFGKDKHPHDRTLRVTVTTIDELAKKYGKPAFVKMDIEGSEFQALQGMTDPIPGLCFEFASGYIEEAWKCLRYLDEMGYEFNYTDGHHGHFELKGWRSEKDFEFNMPEKNEAGKFTWGNVFARLRDATD